MSIRTPLLLLGSATLMAVAGALPSQSLTMQECSAKYKQAQASGTLKGMNWRAFRKAECGPGASAAAAPSTTTTTPAPAPGTAGRTARAGTPIFPTGIAPKYAKETAGRARMHTCLDQYRANKAGNGNAGLKWVQRGGGYYSECNKRLTGG